MSRPATSITAVVCTGPSVVAEGDRKQNWEFYQHLWLALLCAADADVTSMDGGEHGQSSMSTSPPDLATNAKTHLRGITTSGTRKSLASSLCPCDGLHRVHSIAAALHADGETSGPTWRQSLYTALMRSSLATLHNLDLHYQLTQQPADVKNTDSGSVAALSTSPVRGVLAMMSCVHGLHANLPRY